MQEIGRRWLTLPGNVRGSLIVLLASLISVLMTSLIKHVVRLSMVEKQSAFLTVKYKLHNPSQRRRAMLLDAMRRAHLGYDKILKAVRPDVEAIAGMDDRKARFEGYRLLQRRLQSLAKPLPLGNGPKQSIIADAKAQAESYVELKRADDNTSYPTTPRLKVEQSDFDGAIDGIANSQTILEENEFRDLLAKLSRPGIPRPLNILKNRVSDGALVLQDDKGRLFAYINLLPKTAKRKRQVNLTGLVDTRTGEIMKARTVCFYTGVDTEDPHCIKLPPNLSNEWGVDYINSDRLRLGTTDAHGISLLVGGRANGVEC